jgi:hypothetical protein
MRSREVIRTIETPRFRVEVFVFPEETDPADTIAFGDDAEAKQAEQDYLDKINSGELPWVVIGAEVIGDKGREIGSAYLGGCDFLPFDGEYGSTVGRDLVREAIQDARATLSLSKDMRGAWKVSA